MPPLTQTQMQALPDVLTTDRFILNFGSIPITGDSYGALSLKCVDVSMPGSQNARFDVPLGNVDRSFRGKKTYGRQFSAAFSETVDLSSLRKLRNWLEACAGTDSGNSQGYISDYAVTANLQVFDTTGAAADYCDIFRCFIFDLQDIGLENSQTQGMRATAQFSYDYVQYAGVPIL